MNALSPSSADAHSAFCILHSALGIEDARTLVANPLWPRIRAFLWDFASLCDPSRLVAALSGGSGVSPDRLAGGSGDLPRLLSTLSGGSGASPDRLPPRVAASALRSLGLSPVFHTFPDSDGSRLLLLSREDYDRLAQFLGVVALAPALRRVTLGTDVRALRAALPGVYPDALAYEAYFRRYGPLFERLVPTDEAISPATVQSTGHSILAAAISSLSPELLLRQRLRFPEGSPADVALGREAGSVPEASASSAALAAANLALKLSNPTEHRTLCS